MRNLYVATTNIHSKLFRRFILWKNGATKEHVYANTGVLLMNLSLLRKEQSVDEVLAYVRRKRWLLTLPDQDIISTLYGLKIALVDNKIYNLSEREIRWYNRRHAKKIDEDWVERHAKIIHYLSKNKPWKQGYKGILKPWYDKYKIAETAKETP
jgi:lipopolysaccharide biosynthesis glycosyltransferase